MEGWIAGGGGGKGVAGEQIHFCLFTKMMASLLFDNVLFTIMGYKKKMCISGIFFMI